MQLQAGPRTRAQHRLLPTHSLTRRWPPSSADVSQVDQHFGELTVRETLDFSARCQASRTRKSECSATLACAVLPRWLERSQPLLGGAPQHQPQHAAGKSWRCCSALN